MTQPQSDTLTPYAPLPVRARGTLEIFDTAFKLFRRYAGVLLAWSALSSLINLIPFLGQMLYIFTMPLMFGAVSCVVAGAVRGQNVSFKQIWGFTKPRYGALLGVLILAVILMGVVAFALLFGVSLIVILFASFASGYGWFLSGVAWIVGIIGGLIGSSFLLAVVMGWFNLAPVIACLEDANRGSNALSRAWSLLSGNWRKACGVATILALAGTAAMMIISGFSMFFFSSGWDKFVGGDVSFLSGLAISGLFTVFFVAWTPLQAVVGAVFYLDLRTRKEALDLEWTNYAAKPEMVAMASQAPTAPSPAFSPTPQQQPVGPPYAPASSLQATASATLPTQAQTSVFGVQPPAQGQVVEIQPAVAPVPVEATPVQDSFAAFAAQMEAAPQNLAPAPPTPLHVAEVPPTEVQAVSAAPSVPVAPVVPLESVPAPSPAPQPPAVPIEDAGASASVAPTFGGAVAPANSGGRAIEPPPVPVSVEPEPAITPPPPPVPPAQAEPVETSSFAPPRRFRRAPSEDDDYPSSFGGGGR